MQRVATFTDHTFHGPGLHIDHGHVMLDVYESGLPALVITDNLNIPHLVATVEPKRLDVTTRAGHATISDGGMCLDVWNSLHKLGVIERPVDRIWFGVEPTGAVVAPLHPTIARTYYDMLESRS